MFTFFSGAVTPSPSYNFPTPKPSTHPHSNLGGLPADANYYPDAVSSDEEGDFPIGGEWSSDLTALGDDTPNPSDVILDRFSASSPTPLSDDDLPQWSQPRPRTYSRPHRPRIYTSSTVYEGAVPYSYSPPVSFYQQQVIGAWERERERERENDRRRPRGFDPDGGSVWGVVDPEGTGGAADIQEPGSPDKANERFLFPER